MATFTLLLVLALQLEVPTVVVVGIPLIDTEERCHTLAQSIINLMRLPVLSAECKKLDHI